MEMMSWNGRGINQKPHKLMNERQIKKEIDVENLKLRERGRMK